MLRRPVLMAPGSWAIFLGCFTLFSLFLISPPLSAQQGLSTLRGTVTDKSGAIVVGVAPNQGQQHGYIVVGSHKKQNTDETEIVAVRIGDQTLLLNNEGAQVSPTAVMELQEGNEIVVEGEKSKRGVIRASTVVL